MYTFFKYILKLITVILVSILPTYFIVFYPKDKVSLTTEFGLIVYTIIAFFGGLFLIF